MTELTYEQKLAALEADGWELWAEGEAPHVEYHWVLTWQVERAWSNGTSPIGRYPVPYKSEAEAVDAGYGEMMGETP